jgi:hypothetical protein
MSAVNRQWATPLVIGAFALMAVTGGLMFFHLDSALQKTVHEWLGWGLVAAVGLHAVANWLGFKRYFAQVGVARAILVASVVVLAATFVPVPGSSGGVPPPVLALRAVAHAPLKDVAGLVGKSVEQVRSDLAAVGVVIDGADGSIEAATAGDREATGRAVAALLRAAPRN